MSRKKRAQQCFETAVFFIRLGFNKWILCLALSSISCESLAQVGVTQYFPLGVGNRWVYEGKVNWITVTLEVGLAREDILGAGRAFRVEPSSPFFKALGQSIVSHVGETVQTLGTKPPEHDELGESFRTECIPAIVWLDEKLIVSGGVRNFSGQIGFRNAPSPLPPGFVATYSGSSQVTKVGTQYVGIRQFENCVRFESSLKTVIRYGNDVKQGVAKEGFVLAPGIGPISWAVYNLDSSGLPSGELLTWLDLVDWTINEPPRITVHPKPITVTKGGTATFAVTAIGSEPMAFQWQRGGLDIPGAIYPEFVVANATFSDAGSYRVIVRNSLGAVTSSTVNLTVKGEMSALTVQVNGGGIINPNLEGKVLEAGTQQTLSAVPAPGWVLANWTSNLLPPTNRNPLVFTMV
ncbi:MAG: hypothetical protein FJ351_06945, partial [Sphingomonadales bacterium]|nr:hypothetical protein [Sphingomonadales bacterium]